MNIMLFVIAMLALIFNALYFPVAVLGEAALAFVCRVEPNFTAVFDWQDKKWERWDITKNYTNDVMGQVIRWVVLDCMAAFVLLFFLAQLAIWGILWVPVAATAILFGIRAYLDRYNTEWKVKL